ncbi:VanW family protein [Flammeovirga yaeyamensis]|nr:VanW family protein [Flammeovirga yaeyamensis]
MSMQFDGRTYAQNRQVDKLPYRVKKHQSKLIRKLGETDLTLQYNKVENLKIVIGCLNGLIIKPGETFSFYHLVGRPTKSRGFKEGMELSFGKAQSGIGGGICQSTNLLHWLALHSPLTVSERHHHSIDPFPDQGRVLPWASGSAIFYNYLDFQLTNNTEWTFQINLWMTEKTIDGEIRVNEELDFAYHVYETDHQFLKKGSEFYRTNKIWRKKIAKFQSGKLLDNELLYENYGKMLYTPDEYQEIS